MGTISIPAGMPGLIWRMRSLTRSITSTAFCPWRMTTTPDTTSPLPSRSASPRRRSGPTVTWPMSRDSDRRAALAGGHDDALEVGDRLRVAAAAHHVLGAAELDQPPASLDVAAAHRFDDALDREAVIAQPVRVDVHLVLLAVAA